MEEIILMLLIKSQADITQYLLTILGMSGASDCLMLTFLTVYYIFKVAIWMQNIYKTRHKQLKYNLTVYM